MTDNRRFGSWLRALSGLLALVAVLTLSACGGGSGAPSNPYVDGKPIQFLTVLPDTAVDVYLGVPTVLSITGGRPPYTAVSSNTSALPVAASVTGSTITLLANAVAADTNVTVTVRDSDGSTAVSSLVVHPPNALMVLPNTAVDLYAGVPTVLTVSGGTPPYVAASSNSAAVPVATNVAGSTISLMPNNVAADTPVTVTVRDAKGTVADAQLVVHPSTLVSGMKVTPSATECGENAICSGQNGTALVKVLTPNGAPLAGRSIRFDVVSGPFGIVGAGSAIVTTLTVVSDALGEAKVLIKADVNAATQRAQLRATDLTTAQQITGDFLIQQVTDGTKVLSVVPGTAKITGAYKDECSSGFATEYFIYGGTPPYRVTSTFPQAITLINSTVSASGGSFTAVTNGACVDPLTFSIVDAAGRQTTATLSNVVGTADRPTPPVVTVPDLVESPASYTDAACTGKAFSFVLSGGTPPYNVNATNGIVTPQTVASAGGKVSISGLATGSGVTTVVFLDQTVPQKSATATITCTDPGTPPATALSAAPASYASTACTGTTFPIAIFGGVPPYSVTATRGVATPAQVGASGGLSTITGLVTGTGVAAVVVLDSSVPQKSVGVTISCDPTTGGAITSALIVTPGFDYASSTCAGQTSSFAITGGTPPYRVNWSGFHNAGSTISNQAGYSAPPSALPVPVTNSGEGFYVTGLLDLVKGGALNSYVTVSDSGVPTPQQAVRSIVCP